MLRTPEEHRRDWFRRASASANDDSTFDETFDKWIRDMQRETVEACEGECTEKSTWYADSGKTVGEVVCIDLAAEIRINKQEERWTKNLR